MCLLQDFLEEFYKNILFLRGQANKQTSRVDELFSFMGSLVTELLMGPHKPSSTEMG